MKSSTDVVVVQTAKLARQMREAMALALPGYDVKWVGFPVAGQAFRNIIMLAEPRNERDLAWFHECLWTHFVGGMNGDGALIASDPWLRALPL